MGAAGDRGKGEKENQETGGGSIGHSRSQPQNKSKGTPNRTWCGGSRVRSRFVEVGSISAQQVKLYATGTSLQHLELLNLYADNTRDIGGDMRSEIRGVTTGDTTRRNGHKRQKNYCLSSDLKEDLAGKG